MGRHDTVEEIRTKCANKLRLLNLELLVYVQGFCLFRRGDRYAMGWCLEDNPDDGRVVLYKAFATGDGRWVGPGCRQRDVDSLPDAEPMLFQRDGELKAGLRRWAENGPGSAYGDFARAVYKYFEEET